MTNHKRAVRRVTGWSGDEAYFTPREYDRFVPEAVLEVLHGRAACVIFRGMIPAEVCARVADWFWRSPHRKTRGIDAPASYLGAYSWSKSTKQYLDDAEAVNPILQELYDLPDNPMRTFHAGLSAALAAEGAIIRTAEHEGRKASIALVRSWHGPGEFALDPHDDLAQCMGPETAGFERDAVVDHTVAALNMCLENSEGGRLVYWNIQPDAESKRRLGLPYTGSPYPTEVLEGFEVKWIEIRRGDVYVFNGAHVHAVEPNTGNDNKPRTTLGAMMGFINDHTVVTWS